MADQSANDCRTELSLNEMLTCPPKKYSGECPSETTTAAFSRQLSRSRTTSQSSNEDNNPHGNAAAAAAAAAARRTFTPYHSQSVPKSENLQAGIRTRQSDKSTATTMMLRNIPNKYTQNSLMEEIDDCGFRGTYDFFYLPMDVHNRSNVGYAFINFLHPEVASRFLAVFGEHRFQKIHSRKVSSVCCAHVQGLDENLKHFENRAVTHSRNDQYRPVVLKNGERVDFELAVDDAKARLAAARSNNGRKGGGGPGGNGKAHRETYSAGAHEGNAQHGRNKQTSRPSQQGYPQQEEIRHRMQQALRAQPPAAANASMLSPTAAATLSDLTIQALLQGGCGADNSSSLEAAIREMLQLRQGGPLGLNPAAAAAAAAAALTAQQPPATNGRSGAVGVGGGGLGGLGGGRGSRNCGLVGSSGLGDLGGLGGLGSLGNGLGGGLGGNTRGLGPLDMLREEDTLFTGSQGGGFSLFGPAAQPPPPGLPSSGRPQAREEEEAPAYINLPTWASSSPGSIPIGHGTSSRRDWVH